MFDPLFTILFLLAVAVPIAAAVYWIFRKYLTFGSAMWMAFVVPFSGLVGFFMCAVATNTATLFWLEMPPLLRVAMCFTAGCLLAFLMGWVHWKTACRKAAQG